LLTAGNIESNGFILICRPENRERPKGLKKKHLRQATLS